jgi:hypothetical protein
MRMAASKKKGCQMAHEFGPADSTVEMRQALIILKHELELASGRPT